MTGREYRFPKREAKKQWLNCIMDLLIKRITAGMYWNFTEHV